MEERFSELSHILLSMQCALLDAIVPELRAVTVDIDSEGKTLFFSFFYACAVTDELFDLASVASAEVNSDCFNDFAHNTIVHLDCSQPIPVQGWLAYLRKEYHPQAIQFQKPEEKLQMQKMAHTLFHADTGKVIEEKFAKLVRAQLCMQIALLGFVTPALRSVTVDVDIETKTLFHAFFYDGEIAEEIFQLTQAASVEASINLPEYTTKTTIQRIDYPERPPYRGRLVYERKEWR